MQIELLRVFGEDCYQKGGTCVSFIPNKTLALLRSAINKLDTVAMVKDGSGKAITLMHMDKHFNAKRDAHELPSGPWPGVLLSLLPRPGAPIR